MNDLVPETITIARGRGDRTLRFACHNGRETGPYDLDAFAIMRAGERVAPLGLNVEGQTIVARFADPLELNDAWVG